MPRERKALGNRTTSCEPQRRPLPDQKYSQHRSSSLGGKVLFVSFFQPNVVCKLAQPPCLAPSPKISEASISSPKQNYYAKSLHVRSGEDLGLSSPIPVFCEVGNGEPEKQSD